MEDIHYCINRFNSRFPRSCEHLNRMVVVARPGLCQRCNQCTVVVSSTVRNTVCPYVQIELHASMSNTKVIVMSALCCDVCVTV